jgi:hypothetical protein
VNSRTKFMGRGSMFCALALPLFAPPVIAQLVPLSAPSDEAYLAAHPATQPGTIYFNTTEKVDRAYDGTTWHDLWVASPVTTPTPIPDPPVVIPPAPTSPAAGLSLGNHGDLNGFRPFDGAAWTQPVTNVPIDPVFTANWIKENGASSVHMDFGPTYGIPYVVVDGTMTTPEIVPVASTSEATPGESDIVAVPIPYAAPIEGSPSAGTINGDDHMLVLRRDDASLIELYHAKLQPTGGYTSDSTALWDMTSSAPARPFGFTSADAAGLPIFPFLVKHEEFTNPVTGNVNMQDVQTLGHALRMTTNNIRAAFYSYGDAYGGIILPASHSAPNNSGTTNIAGMRLRLDPGFDTSGMSGLALIVANTLKVYGCVIADLGSTGYITGTTDERWTDQDVAPPSIPLSAFQVVAFDHVYATQTPDLSQVHSDIISKVSGPPVGTPPVVSSFVYNNGTLSWQVTGASYVFIDKIGLVTGSSIAAPAGNYTLTASNLYGRAVTSISTAQ